MTGSSCVGVAITRLGVVLKTEALRNALRNALKDAKGGSKGDFERL